MKKEEPKFKVGDKVWIIGYCYPYYMKPLEGVVKYLHPSYNDFIYHVEVEGMKNLFEELGVAVYKTKHEALVSAIESCNQNIERHKEDIKKEKELIAMLTKEGKNDRPN